MHSIKKPSIPIVSPEKEEEINPPKEELQNNDLLCSLAIADSKGHVVYTDLTGKFPVCSYSGMQYIFLYMIIKPTASSHNQ